LTAAAAGRWALRVVLALVLLLVVAAAGIWWWAGQEGSLEWTLQRVAAGQVQTQGVHGSVRSGWRIDRIAWEREGLRLEADDVRLDWQPLALIGRTLRVDLLQVGSVRVIDKRPKDDEPLTVPDNLGIPWRVVVDEVRVARLAYQGTTTVEGSGLAAGYAFDGLRHHVTLKSLKLAGGDYRGDGTLLALPPMTLDTHLAGAFQAPLPGGEGPVPLRFEARARGPLTGFELHGDLKGPAGARAGAELPQASVDARVAPFEKMPVPRGTADFRQLDLAQFWPAAPRTLLSGHVAVQPAGADDWQLQAQVKNALPGPWDAQRLPVANARAEGEWRGGTAMVKALRAELGDGVVEGSGAWHGEGWKFKGKVQDVDPSQLHGSLAALPLTGPIQLAGEGKAVEFDVALQAGTARPPARKPPREGSSSALAAAVGALELREALAQGSWLGDALKLDELRVRTSDALLEGELQVQIQALAGSGELQLRAPGLHAQAKGALSDTRGQGSMELVALDLAQAQRWLRRWPGLGAMLEGGPLRGHAEARLAWQGGWRDPSVQGRITANGVEWGAPAPAGAAAPMPWVLRSGELRLDGRLRDALLDLRAAAEQGQRKVALTASGRVNGTLGGANVTWRGQLASLAVQVQDPGITSDPWRLQVRRPVDWRFGGGAFELSAGEAVLNAPAMRSGAPASEAVLAWSPVRQQGGQLTTAGRLSGLPLSWIELVGGPELAGSALSGDMVFDAQWNAQLGNNVRVDASLARVRGDVTVLAESADGAAARVPAGVRDARLTVSSQGEQLTLALLWDSERAGHAEGQVRTRLVRSGDGGWQWPEQAPLAGNVRAQLPRIGVWSLLAPPGWRLRGALSADIAVGGTRAQPQLSGPLVADDLALRSVVDGIELRNGRLRAQLSGQKLVVSEFMLRGSEEGGAGGGSLVANGEGEWTAQGPQLQVNAQLTQLRASIRSDRQLTVSGTMAARMGTGGTEVTGKLRVDRARIQIPDESPPRLGDDVVVRNAPGVPATEAERRQRPPAAAPTEAGRTVTLTVSIDLGEDFRVAGRGVDTRLEGTVDIEGRSLAMPRLEGVIHTAGGTYNGYGERMNIERGEIRFTGAADNPALDILAIRPNLTQRVGVQITGRAQAPHVELYSEAGLSEAETLSWLVLGRSSAGGGAETALLQRAASALVAGRKGNTKGIAGNLGLDDLSVGRDATSGPVVRLGKRFADNFYAGYERSLSGAMGTLYIFYDVSRRLTVRAEAGERTGLDLIFTFAFDRKK
jgi:translocation and assembly module TamB